MDRSFPDLLHPAQMLMRSQRSKHQQNMKTHLGPHAKTEAVGFATTSVPIIANDRRPASGSVKYAHAVEAKLDSMRH